MPLVQVVRDGLVESVHFGSRVVLGPDGEVLEAGGEVDEPGYPRSTAKLMQAAGMVRLGLDLPPDLLALAAASHSAEEFHLAGARAILGDLSEDDLQCPAHLPHDPVLHDVWIAEGRAPRRLAHCCSGKHAAMLATAKLNGWSTHDYRDPAHPLQQALAATVAELAGEPVAHTAVDGCGAPLFAISLRGLARAVRRVATAPHGTPEHRVAEAIRKHPEMLAGPNRDVTQLMRAVPGLIAKDGAEAVQIAVLPDGTTVALKIADGSARARMPATLAALRRAAHGHDWDEVVKRCPALNVPHMVGL
ncbi:asparaginase [Amycolatopsis endophytica]|uniref:asparaginase n=1 Tax=Amycolatopsis endophytica TaxID=860233 RepID=UPI0015CD33A7|nr:asparaginase [Amycolatopsis endophytica]